MGVDRKADHVGNHGGVYTDIHGQTKQFTYVDHDVKLSRTPLAHVRAYKEPEMKEQTENERFCLGIIYSGMSSEPAFIKAFDQLMEAAGSMRYRKGTPVEITSLLKEDEAWISGLRGIFQTCIKDKIKELKSYL